MTITTRLNDVDIASVGALVDKIKEEPAAADTTWAASVRWTGGFRSEARVRDFEPVPSDEPGGLGGTDQAPNPVEQLLAALGNCLAVGYAANATVAGIELRDVRIDVQGDVDLHTFLGLGGAHAGFSGISATVHIDSDADPSRLAALHDAVTATSPVGHTLARAIPVDVSLA
jgi:uncharacterized OsmC-like protein